MKLIDADKLEEELLNYMKVQEDTAEAYNIADGTYVKLQRTILFNVLDMIRAQPEVKQGKVAKWYRSKGVQLSEE